VPLDLIGLIRASRNREAPGQGFKNYVAGSPTTGTAMTDYMTGTPLVLSTVQTYPVAPTTKVGQLTVTAASYNPGNGEVPPYYNVQYTATFNAGSKWDSILDAAYVAADGTNQVVIQPVTVDLPQGSINHPGSFPWASVRSLSVNTATRTLTVVITYQNYYEDTGSTQIGNSGRVTVPIQLTFQPEPHFNLRAYSGIPSPGAGIGSGVVPILTVQPFIAGQPTIYSYGTMSIATPQLGSSFSGSGNIAENGDFRFTREAPGTNIFYQSGVQFRALNNASWSGVFEQRYPNDGSINTRQLRYSWDLWENGQWVEKQSLTSTSTSGTASTYIVDWTYSSNTPGTAPSVAQIQVRFRAQVISPFTSGEGSTTFTYTVPNYTQYDTGGSGGTQF
jgi:hypothetical protein